MRRGDRVIWHYDLVHVVKTGEVWGPPMGRRWGCLTVCGMSYLSDFKLNGTKKLPTSCLWCAVGATRC